MGRRLADYIANKPSNGRIKNKGAIERLITDTMTSWSTVIGNISRNFVFNDFRNHSMQ